MNKKRVISLFLALILPLAAWAAVPAAATDTAPDSAPVTMDTGPIVIVPNEPEQQPEPPPDSEDEPEKDNSIEILPEGDDPFIIEPWPEAQPPRAEEVALPKLPPVLSIKPKPFASIDDAAQFVADNHVLMLRADGRLLVWGDNTSGQLGLGDGAPQTVYEPTENTFFRDKGVITQIAVIQDASFVLMASGDLYSFGKGLNGRLGQGVLKDYTEPKLIAGSRALNIQTLHPGGEFILAETYDNTLLAWGKNSIGQCGDGTTVDILTPKKVVDNADVKHLLVGKDSTTLIKQDNTFWYWGQNVKSQYGTDIMLDLWCTKMECDGSYRSCQHSNTLKTAQVRFYNLPSTNTPKKYESLEIMATNNDRCVGEYTYHKHGSQTNYCTPTSTTWDKTPATNQTKNPLMANVNSITMIQKGNDHGVFELNGRLYGFGYNNFNQLGTTVPLNGIPYDLTEVNAEIAAMKLDALTYDDMMVAGDTNYFYFKDNDTKKMRLFVLGSNASGKAGLGTVGGSLTTLTEITALADKGIKQIIPGRNTNFYICENGEIYVTGDNSKGTSGLGEANKTKKTIPSPVLIDELKYSATELPPDPPERITTPVEAYVTQEIGVDWKAPSSADAKTSYILERAVEPKTTRTAGAAAGLTNWETVYKGTATTYKDTINPSWGKVVYKVRTQNFVGDLSGEVVAQDTTVTIDTIPPVVAITPPTGWNKIGDIVNVPIAATDNWEIQSLKYKVNDGASQDITATKTAVVTDNCTLSATAVDRAGNPKETSVQISVFDKESPTITITPPTGWHKVGTPVQVPIQAADNWGIGSIEYKINNDPTQDITTSKVATVTDNCTLYAMAIDLGGNPKQAEETITVFDKEKPSVSYTVSSDKKTVTLTATDGQSGPKEIVVNGRTYAGSTAVHTVTGKDDLSIHAVDNCDNVGEKIVISYDGELLEDLILPEVSITPPTNWSKEGTPVDVQVIASDNVGLLSVEYKINTGAWQDITTTRRITVTDNCTIYVKAVDKAGNARQVEATVRIFDKEKPYVSYRVSSNKMTVTVTGEDGQSGIREIVVNGRTYNGGTATHTVSGKSDITMYSVDKCDNRSDELIISYTAELAPDTSNNGGGNTGNGGGSGSGTIKVELPEISINFPEQPSKPYEPTYPQYPNYPSYPTPPNDNSQVPPLQEGGTQQPSDTLPPAQQGDGSQSSGGNSSTQPIIINNIPANPTSQTAAPYYTPQDMALMQQSKNGSGMFAGGMLGILLLLVIQLGVVVFFIARYIIRQSGLKLQISSNPAQLPPPLPTLEQQESARLKWGAATQIPEQEELVPQGISHWAEVMQEQPPIIPVMPITEVTQTIETIPETISNASVGKKKKYSMIPKSED